MRIARFAALATQERPPRIANCADLESHILTNGYVMSVCTAEQEKELVTAIEPILKKFGGVCIVSDAK